MKEKSASVMEAGGVDQLEKLMQELPELLQRNTDLLNESERMLREEKDSDDKLRAQYKVRLIYAFTQSKGGGEVLTHLRKPGV